MSILVLLFCDFVRLLESHIGSRINWISLAVAYREPIFVGK